MEPHLLPQPAPDLPKPPRGPEAIRSQGIKRRILWVGGICVAIPLLLGLMVLLVLRSQKNTNRTEARHNLRQVGALLHKFESRYGKFPDDSTIPTVQAQDRTKLVFGSSYSNDYFRQLIATVTNSERIFFADVLPRHFYPDDLTGPKALQKDECSFAYVAGFSSSNAPETPVAMAPLVPSTMKFDPKPFGGIAVVLFVDGTVKTLPIGKNGNVIANGLNLLDARQPYWHGKAPDLKWPE